MSYLHAHAVSNSTSIERQSVIGVASHSTKHTSFTTPLLAHPPYSLLIVLIIPLMGAQDSTMVVDNRGRICWGTSQLAELLGYPLKTLLSPMFPCLCCSHAPDRRSFCQTTENQGINADLHVYTV